MDNHVQYIALVALLSIPKNSCKASHCGNFFHVLSSCCGLQHQPPPPHLSRLFFHLLQTDLYLCPPTPCIPRPPTQRLRHSSWSLQCPPLRRPPSSKFRTSARAPSPTYAGARPVELPDVYVSYMEVRWMSSAAFIPLLLFPLIMKSCPCYRCGRASCFLLTFCRV